MPIPFFRKCICTKALGGKHTLWQARVIPQYEELIRSHGTLPSGANSFWITSLTGAGKNADLAIKDLQKQIRLLIKGKLAMTFGEAKTFLESWGMHFETPDGEATNIPYPQVYHRMCEDAKRLDPSGNLRKYISLVTATTDGETYLALDSWNELATAWELYTGDKPN